MFFMPFIVMGIAKSTEVIIMSIVETTVEATFFAAAEKMSDKVFGEDSAAKHVVTVGASEAGKATGKKAGEFIIKIISKIF